MTGSVLEPATVEGAARLAMAQDRNGVIKRAQAKYLGAWWLSSDPYTLANMQLREEVLLVPFRRFHEAVELVLGREVRVEEFAAPKNLISEIEALG